MEVFYLDAWPNLVGQLVGRWSHHPKLFVTPPSAPDDVEAKAVAALKTPTVADGASTTHGWCLAGGVVANYQVRGAAIQHCAFPWVVPCGSSCPSTGLQRVRRQRGKDEIWGWAAEECTERHLQGRFLYWSSFGKTAGTCWDGTEWGSIEVGTRVHSRSGGNELGGVWGQLQPAAPGFRGDADSVRALGP